VTDTTFEIPADRRGSLDMLKALIEARQETVNRLKQVAEHAVQAARAEIADRLAVLAKECGFEVPEGAGLVADFDSYEILARVAEAAPAPEAPKPKVLPRQAKRRASRAKKKATKKKASRKRGTK